MCRLYQYLALFLIIFFLSLPKGFANSPPLSLEFERVNLTDAIRVLAKFLNMNVILSSTVKGIATLQLADAYPIQAFDTLLLAHGLAKSRIGNVWLIAPEEELLKQKEIAQKWRQVSEDTAPLWVHVWRIKYAKAEELAEILKDVLSTRGHVRVDARTNQLFIEDSAKRLADVKRLIHELDVPIQQISIEARLASVDHDFERELGIDFSVNAPHEENTAAFKEKAGHYSLAIAKLADGSLLDVKLSALENEGHAELISSPSLFTENQQAASIEAGEEVPYQEVSESGGTAVVFKKAVLSLQVTPQVLPGNKVLLKLKINQDRPSNKMVLGVPTISTRQIMTNVLVRNAQTIVLGGIYEKSVENGQERIPFISRIPVLGWLFTQQTRRENKRELLIFVTPRIIAKDV